MYQILHCLMLRFSLIKHMYFVAINNNVYVTFMFEAIVLFCFLLVTALVTDVLWKQLVSSFVLLATIDGLYPLLTDNFVSEEKHCLMFSSVY